MAHPFFDGGDDEAGPARGLGFWAMGGRMAALFRPHRRRLGGGAALLLLATAADVASPLVLRHLIDVDIAAGSKAGVVRSALVFLGLFVIARAASYAKVLLFARMGLDIVTRLKRRLFDHVMTLSLSYFDDNPTGRLLARVESDTERLLAFFSEVGLAIIGSVVMLLATIAVMLATDWRITVGVLVLLVPIAIANVWFIGWIRAFYTRARQSYARLAAFLTEHVQAIPVIQVYGLERDALRRLDERNRELVGAELAADFRAMSYWGLIAGCEVAVVMAVLYLGSQRLFGEAMQVGTLVLFVEYARRLFEPVLAFSEQLGFVQRAFASGERVFEVLDTPSRTPERADALTSTPRDFQEIRFEDVSFAYDDTARALDGVSFSVRRGEHVALVGRSGGGKTTLAKLLLRFYEPTAGRITVDGVDIRAFTHAAWRRMIGLVLQDIHLFPGTLRENLAVFRGDIPEAELRRAVAIVQADDLVGRLPGGLDAQISEGGQNLSLGERQLVSFARAITRDPAILVLDEATSSVDPGTERRLQRALHRALEGRAGLAIAHRLSTVRTADRILLVDAGKIAASGTHDELLAASELYRELCRLQLREAAPAAGSAGAGSAPTPAATAPDGEASL